MAITLNGTTGVTTTGLTSNGIDDNATSTAMTLDTSGNLLVGTTSTSGFQTSSSATGTIAYTGGAIASNVSGDAPLYLNRLTSDGAIATFRKDGTTVGSIGVRDGDNLYITGGTGSTKGIFLNDNTLGPAATTTGAGSDATTNLGASTIRFKDLYLSGGVYLGGTGAANKLDDYEEGTWTPILRFGSGYTSSYSEQIGTYTKIGRAVTVTYRIVIGTKGPHTGAITVNGLPFTVANTGLYPAFYGLHHNINSGSGGSVSGQLPVNQLLANQTYAGFYTSNSTGSPVAVTEAYVSNGSVLNGTVTYMST